jgi:glycosyltransferase involved in cell wall biosynthesis
MQRQKKNLENKIMMIGTLINGKGGVSSVIQGYRNAGLFEKLNIEYFETHGGGSKKKKVLIFLNQLIKILFRIHEFNIIHLQTASYWSFRRKFILILISKIFKKKIIIHIHGAKFISYFSKSIYIEKLAIMFAFKISDIIICLSPEWHKDLKKIYNEAKIITIPNSIKIALSTEDLDYNKNTKNKNILFFGRLGKRKGVYELIEAAKQIDFEKFNAQIYLCGDGEIELISKKIFDLKLEDHIRVLGWVEGNKKNKIYKEGYIFILPSYFEGLPMSILEAMSYGLPIISTTVGGIPYAVKNGIEGFLIEPGNYNLLAKRINTLLEDESLRNKMSSAAKRKISEMFTIEILEGKLKIIYQHLNNNKNHFNLEV